MKYTLLLIVNVFLFSCYDPHYSCRVHGYPLSPLLVPPSFNRLSQNNYFDLQFNHNSSFSHSFLNKQNPEAYQHHELTIHSSNRQTASNSFTNRAPGDNSALFGSAAVTPAPSSQFSPGVHPRVLFNASQWEAIISSYAANYDTPNSWSRYHRLISSTWSPAVNFINKMSTLDTSAYKGDLEDLSQWSASERETLGLLADQILIMNEPESHALFLCTMWAAVNDKLTTEQQFLSANMTTMCKDAAVAWAKVLLAHRAYNCASACPSGAASSRAFLWDHTRRYEVRNDWMTAGMNLALVYDILFDQMNSSELRVIRSALAMLVLEKFSWGCTETSTSSSPNAAIHPHRIFSNWATYHSNLFLTNLAIEHDTDFDTYTSAVLQSFGSTKGFNERLDFRYSKLLEAYMSHSVYPDGSTFEDGYTYFIALREGSLGLIAATRRGYNLIDTTRFRNLILNLEQMSEPWHCGEVIGHASGGGLSYATYAAFFRYTYPNGALPAVVWRRRFGSNFQNGQPCRISWYQHFTQISILGGEHNTQVSTAISVQDMPTSLKNQLPKMVFAKRRGIVFMRNSWDESATYSHFDARPDAFFPGHDNADRGVFTFTSLRQTWITDLPDWSKNVDSRKHSLLHVDGLAQDEKSPSVRMVQVADNDDLVLASADLTYAYNVQWARNWPDHNPPVRHVVTYDSSGQESKVNVLFTVQETGDPRSFGWPSDDDGEDLGMTRTTSNMWGDPDMGFKGMYTWKRAYRTTTLEHVVRSVVLLRNFSENGILIVGDSVAPADSTVHIYESYLVLQDDISVDLALSQCSGSKCTIVLQAGSNKKAEITALASKSEVLLSFRKESFITDKTHTRLVIKTSAAGDMQLWLVLQSKPDSNTNTVVQLNDGNILQLFYSGTVKNLTMDDSTHMVKIAQGPNVASSPSTTPTMSQFLSASSSSSPVASQSPSISLSTSPVLSQSISTSPDVSQSPSAPLSAPPSSSPIVILPSSSPSASSAISQSSSASPSAVKPPPTLTTSTSLNPSTSSAISSMPSPSQPTLPMKPMPMPDLGAKRIPLKRFSSNQNKFLHVTNLTHQALLRLKIGNRLSESKSVEILSTCNRFTKNRAVTSIAVFWCGNNGAVMKNYYKRLCQRIDNTHDSYPCVLREVVYGAAIHLNETFVKPGSTLLVSISARRSQNKPLAAQIVHTIKQ